MKESGGKGSALAQACASRVPARSRQALSHFQNPSLKLDTCHGH